MDAGTTARLKQTILAATLNYIIGARPSSALHAWRGTISVLVARGRAQVGVHAAKSEWPKRIRDSQFMDYDDH